VIFSENPPLKLLFHKW